LPPPAFRKPRTGRTSHHHHQRCRRISPTDSIRAGLEVTYSLVQQAHHQNRRSALRLESSTVLRLSRSGGDDGTSTASSQSYYITARPTPRSATQRIGYGEARSMGCTNVTITAPPTTSHRSAVCTASTSAPLATGERPNPSNPKKVKLDAREDVGRGGGEPAASQLERRSPHSCPFAKLFLDSHVLSNVAHTASNRDGSLYSIIRGHS
jgi:hypothetical protein